MSATYRGRFAPTPSGPLHFGSLLTALASYLDARQAQGKWLLRIDDLDGPRCVEGAEQAILAQLQQHGMVWDEPPYYQSEQAKAYQTALKKLHDDQHLYACRCTRRLLRQTGLPGPDAPVYPGSCREARWPEVGSALRLRLPVSTEQIEDRWQGSVSRDLQTEVGDFIVRRVDELIAYQLACAVDEDQQGITHVVRGADLLSSTFAQRAVARALGLTSPQYGHLPVVLGPDGKKLSKQHHAPPIDPTYAADNLKNALVALGQPRLPGSGHSVAHILEHAVAVWNPAAIPAGTSITVQQSSAGR